MANWRYHLEISDVWEKLSEGEIAPNEFGKVVAQRLRELQVDSMELDEIIESFEALSEEDDDDDVNCCMFDLYEWGDSVIGTTKKGFMENRMCWIETMNFDSERRTA
jgi:hypothetical protein